MDEELPPNPKDDEKAFVGPIMLDFSLPFANIKSIKIEDEDLNIEQLPQLLKLYNAKEILWKYRARIIGVDGSEIVTEGDIPKEPFIILTPLHIKSIPWSFIKINKSTLINLIKDLIPCSEGEGYFNPSPWDRKLLIDKKWYYLHAGELTEKISIQTQGYEITDKIESNFYNPKFYFLNPFYIEESRKPINSSSFISLQSDYALSLISSDPFNIKFDLGKIEIESENPVYIIKSKRWNEAKPARISWDLKNNVINLDCKPKYNVSLYKLEPSSVIPLYLDYKDNELFLILENFSNDDIISTMIFSARIESAIADGEELVTEFDRVRIPIRRWGIKNIRIKLRKLIEPYLKRKIIA
ncbi:hypothetical protein [Acidianus sp. HS-5]|uniref:hypothetical protein n=1 Tax=Acidianus sp. HS-5 TaxID=2886040 RepID=UPI001F291DED|nr:hypothetical protein [Acidianus sp. HS-5]BDC19905.1 hypothetical protein HS5_27950 [Acidianus sp. HS-5]